jgi:phospholipid/cholesterol/gamma-HCH transport system substrate-binding protein
VIKQAPSVGRILAMVLFSMSCVGILLFLWLSFGGAIPLKPEAYRVKVAFPEAIGVINDVDVRAAGITIGTVRDVEVDERTNRTVATLAIQERYAPIRQDARAILRRKTLLGETFVEMTTGTRGKDPVEDGGRLDDGRVGQEVELDEVFQTYDPITRRAIQLWQQELGLAVEERGEELNNALGELPEFAGNASDLLEVLYRQDDSVRRLVRGTGDVYGALTRDEAQLRNLIRNSHDLFGQTARERVALAEAIHIFPTYLVESRDTLKRLEGFSRNARPLVRDLRPVAEELRPTIRAVRGLAPHLRNYFDSFDTQIDVYEEAGPDLREVIRGTRPTLRSLGPFLQEFNPIFQWIELNQLLVSDFLGNAASATADTVPGVPAGEVGHYLRQLSVSGSESIGIHQRRVSSNRGNAYLPPVYTGRRTARRLIQPSWDCIPAGVAANGEVAPSPGPPARPGCWTYPNLEFQGRRQGRFSHVLAADYSR